MKKIKINLYNEQIQNKKVGILCTCYDKDYSELELTFTSLSKIDYNNFVFYLVVDDAYQQKYDYLIELINKYSNINYEFFYSGENYGNYSHYNNLINYTDCEFIFLTAPNTYITSSFITKCIEIFNKNDNIDIIQYKYIRKNLYFYEDLQFFFKEKGYWGDSMIFFKKKIVTNIGYFDNVRYAGDSNFFKRIRTLMPDRIYYADILGCISFGSCSSTKFIKERHDYYENTITKSDMYTYLKNNNLTLNYSFVENMPNMCKYTYNIYNKNKIKILFLSHDFHFLNNIINELDKNTFDIEKKNILVNATVLHRFCQNLSNFDSNIYFNYQKELLCLNNNINNILLCDDINKKKSDIMKLIKNIKQLQILNDKELCLEHIKNNVIDKIKKIKEDSKLCNTIDSTIKNIINTVDYIKSNVNPELSNVIELCNLIEQLNNYDIVWYEWFEAGIPFITHLKNKKFKFVVRLHCYEFFYYDEIFDCYDVKNKKIFMDFTNFNNVDNIIVVNKWFKYEFEKLYNFNKVIIFPNKYNEFKNNNLTNRNKVIGVVGVNSISKGLFKILEIFEKIVNCDKDYKLYIKGDININCNTSINDFSPEECATLYNNTITKINIMMNKYKNNIFIFKHSDEGGENMETFYNSVQFLLAASICESFHCVIMESGTAGCIPIIYNYKEYEKKNLPKTPDLYRIIDFENSDDIVKFIINHDKNLNKNHVSKTISNYYKNINFNLKEIYYFLINLYNNNLTISESYWICDFFDCIKINDYLSIFNNYKNTNKRELIIINNDVFDHNILVNYFDRIIIINMANAVFDNYKLLLYYKLSSCDKLIIYLIYLKLNKLDTKFIHSYYYDEFLNYLKNDYFNINYEYLINFFPKIVAVIPVYKREILLKYTIRRLYFNNKIYKIICVGDKDTDKNIALAENALWIEYSNEHLGKKWNHGFKLSKIFNPDAILFVGSSDWISTNWILKNYKYVQSNNIGYVGKNDFHMLDISNFKILSCHWLGYINYDRKKETIGIGRLLSKNFLEKINYEPFNDDKNIGMDKNMYLKCIDNNFEIKIVEDSNIFLSISCDLWKNKHNFYYHYCGATKNKNLNDNFFQEYYELYANSKLHSNLEYNYILQEFLEIENFYKEYLKFK